jgi:hypothetical protein
MKAAPVKGFRGFVAPLHLKMNFSNSSQIKNKKYIMCACMCVYVCVRIYPYPLIQ